MTLQIAERTHPGNVRLDNEDRVSSFRTPVGEVFIVADGMGGHTGGARASAMVVERFQQHLNRLSAIIAPPMALQAAAQATNADVLGVARTDPTTLSMGATVVVALVRGDQVVVGHAGDSRAYVFQEGRLTRITRDHSLIQEMLDRKILTEQQARTHPEAHIITRAVGERHELVLEISPPITVQRGDALLLCTDGLTGAVDDRAIEGIVGNPDASVAQVSDALLAAALAAGGRDNITVQFVRF